MFRGPKGGRGGKWGPYGVKEMHGGSHGAKLYVVSALVYLCTVGALWGNRPYTKPTPQHICLIL